jgi:mRNA-degrading endonuclease RelE of RelBE toxin-antitoxin system
MWNLRYTADAIAGMYSIPRGAAAEVTAAIRELQRIPLPYGASPEPTGKPNTYVITVADHTVTYELAEQDRIVRILTVE